MKGKRGQAAIEYLITYGWAFAVILAAVGVLAYFGFLNPERYIPESCGFGEQLQCVDYFIDDQDTILLRMQNAFEESIDVVDVYHLDGAVTLDSPVTIPRGEVARVEMTHTLPLFEGEKERIELVIEFVRTGGSINHNVSGVVFAEVADSDLGLI